MRLAVAFCVAACGSTAAPPTIPANSSKQPPCLAERMRPLAKAPKQGTTCIDRSSCSKACEAGDGRSCTAIAWEYEASGDSDNAARHFQRACELADPIACTNFAAGFANRPDATPADLACAVRVFRLTCDADEPWGCGMLGKALVDGKGVTADRAAAVTLLDAKCASIGSFACYVPAALAERTGDPVRALELYTRACATGMDGACADVERLRDRSWRN